MNLNGAVSDHFRITPAQKAALSRLRIETIDDLLRHFPVRYGDTAEARNIDSLDRGASAVIFGKLSDLKASKGFKSHMTMSTGTIEDESGKLQLVWFNQPYISKMYSDGSLVRIEGKVSERRKTGELYMSNPRIERIAVMPIGVGDSLFGEDGESHSLYPIYPESRGVTSSWLYHAMQKAFKSGILDEIEDPIPEAILKRYSLPGLKTALIWIHAPQKRDDALAARKRFAFEEIFVIQLGKQKARKRHSSQPSLKLEIDSSHVREFVRRFPFTATGAQIRAIDSILADMGGDKAMARLLEGDVGSGKTAVAAATTYAVIAARKQIAYMCPTEILATQHFESFIRYFSYMPIQIGLITGSGCRKFPSKVNPKGWTDISRPQLLKWVENGEIAVLVGTHALIQASVRFKELAYAIIDEQHRFGTAQRAKLVRKNQADAALGSAPIDPEAALIAAEGTGRPVPHLLSMTATPIPRTLALTMYGDLDLTLLDESPAGRKPVITELVLPDKRDETYEKIRRELAEGRQMYVICPRIDEPDPDKEAAVIAKSVKEEAKRLKEKVFPEHDIGVLHGRMGPKEKDRAMEDFRSGRMRILCATSVVEVGMNVPNATVIIIEGAERFGLAQLHQLRGRVMRSDHQAYCYAFTETVSERSIERLKALQTAKNGFELAELDLAQRGAGLLSGARQWGVSDIAMEALRNQKMVEAARKEAADMIEKDPDLAQNPALQARAASSALDSHFE
ncbi:ATP-dependent DNA helicase RecG [Patescibacteria group bacterium]|nr:ATP-dependent DNA helicase RecG [Patescibacteria group bacterium]